jgi:hypothetical protein
MELIKSESKLNSQKNKSSIFLKFKSSFSKNKYNISYKYENINNSLKLKNTQSISTDEDDLKESEIKEISSTKNIFPKKIIKNFRFINEDYSPNKIEAHLLQQKIASKNVSFIPNIFKNKIISQKSKNKTNNYNNIKILENGDKLKNDINSNFTNSKNINEMKNNVNLEKTEQQKKTNKIFKKENNKSNNILIDRQYLKSFPPKKPSLFNNEYIFLENNNKNNTVNKSCIYMDRSKIPNIFYNHLMLQNDEIQKKQNSKYMTISTTNRIKGKLVTILYIRPIKIFK